MAKNFMFKFLFIGIFLACAILWLMHEMQVLPEGFNFTLGWAIVVAAGGTGTLYILTAFFSKTLTTFKKMYILVGAGLLVVALFALIGEVSMPDNYVMPIIAIIGAGALMLMLFATGGKKWDQGDNHNVGYENYHQRKAREERERKERGEE